MLSTMVGSIVFFVYGLTSVGPDLYRDARGWVYVTENCKVVANDRTGLVTTGDVGTSGTITFGMDSCKLVLIGKAN